MPTDKNTQTKEPTLEEIIKAKDAEIAELKAKQQSGICVDYDEIMGLHIVGPCKNVLDKIADGVASGDKMADRFLTLACGKINVAKGTNTGFAQLTTNQIEDLNKRADYKVSTQGLKTKTWAMR